MNDYEKERDRLRELAKRFKAAIGVGLPLPTVTVHRDLAQEVAQVLDEAHATPILRNDLRLVSDLIADLHEIWHRGGKVESRAFKIARRLNLPRARTRPRYIAENFAALVTCQGDLLLLKRLDPSVRRGDDEIELYRRLLDRLLVSDCPKSPVEAIKIMADFHDFPSTESCLHWLLREKQKIQNEIEKDHDEDAEQLGDLLRGLGRLPDKRML